MKRGTPALILALLLAGTTTGRPPSKGVPVESWTPYNLPETARDSPVTYGRTGDSGLVPGPSRAVSTPPTGRTGTPERSPVTGSVSGVPTWYCEAGVSRCTHGYPPDCYCAAAGPTIRAMWPDWRGKLVTVCAERCIQVRLVDFCACAAPHFLDLYHVAWVALGRPRWATVMKVGG